MFRTGAPFIILVLLVGLFTARESRQQPARGLDEGFADFLARNSRRHEQPAPLTLVEIDRGTLQDHPWPWSPLDFALFFQAANAFRPAALATDEVLRWPERSGGEQSQKLFQYKKILREHLLRAPKVLLGSQLGVPEDPQVIPALEEVPLIRNVRGDVSAIPEFTTIDAQAEELFRLSSSVGMTNLPTGDVAIHSVPLLLRYRGQLVPTFVLQAILLWEKVATDEVTVEAGEHVTLAGRVDIPIDSVGRMRVDFGVPREHCAFEELVLASAQVDSVPPVPMLLSPDILNGKLLLLGRTDPEAQTLNFAAGRRGSPSELFAAAIATIQTRSFLRRVGNWFDGLVIGGAMLASAFAPRWGRGATAIGAILFTVIYTMVAISVFGSTLVWIPIILPACLAVFIALYRMLLPVPAH